MSPYTNLSLGYASSPLSSFGLCITYFSCCCVPSTFWNASLEKLSESPCLVNGELDFNLSCLVSLLPFLSFWLSGGTVVVPAIGNLKDLKSRLSQ